MWQKYTNGFDKTVQMDLTKLYKRIRNIYTNGCEKTKHVFD